MSNPAAGGSQAYLTLLRTLPAGQAKTCERPEESAKILEARAFSQWLRERAPKTPGELIAALVFLAAVGFVFLKLLQSVLIAAAPAWAMRHFRPFKPVKIPLLQARMLETLDAFAITRTVARQPFGAAKVDSGEQGSSRRVRRSQRPEQLVPAPAGQGDLRGQGKRRIARQRLFREAAAQ